jgi:hypothetical protein
MYDKMYNFKKVNNVNNSRNQRLDPNTRYKFVIVLDLLMLVINLFSNLPP